MAPLMLAACAHTSAPPATAPTPDRSRGGVALGGVSASSDSTGRPQTTGTTGEAHPRPYNRVITAQAKTRRGLFAVHRVGDKLYF